MTSRLLTSSKPGCLMRWVLICCKVDMKAFPSGHACLCDLTASRSSLLDLRCQVANHDLQVEELCLFFAVWWIKVCFRVLVFDRHKIRWHYQSRVLTLRRILNTRLFLSEEKVFGSSTYFACLIIIIFLEKVRKVQKVGSGKNFCGCKRPLNRSKINS